MALSELQTGRLAIDRNVSDRWVLKGLLDFGDADAMAAAVAERRFVAQVNQPNVVTIHNFVQHPDSNDTPVGYIVMEWRVVAQGAAGGSAPAKREHRTCAGCAGHLTHSWDVHGSDEICGWRWSAACASRRDSLPTPTSGSALSTAPTRCTAGPG